MKKPAELRQAVKAAIPALANDPDKLLVFADEGRVLSHGTSLLSFEYRYTLNLILTDMTGSADEVMLAVMTWAQVNQPELLAVNDERNNVTFEVDQVTHDTYDLSLKLPLSEAVRVTVDQDGRRVIEHVDEEAPEWARVGLV